MYVLYYTWRNENYKILEKMKTRKYRYMKYNRYKDWIYCNEKDTNTNKIESKIKDW